MNSLHYINGLGQKPASPVSPGTIDRDGDLATLNKRYEQFMLYDQERTKFMKELVVRYEYLHQQHQVSLSERLREQDVISQWQVEKAQYNKWIKTMQRAMADNSFLVVLIDGDGMIFLDEFLRDGEKGGRRAASALYAAVQNYIEHEVNGIPPRSRIVCRIYANVRGLAEVLVRTGAIQEISDFEDFVRGFTRGKILFDFIDVGAGKDRADEKIIETFKLFSQDLHCRRVFLGCSHDNGYARTLEQCSDNPELLDKVVLLEGVPFEKELVPLPYSTKKFPGLFRESKINLWSAANMFNPPQSSTPMHSSPKTYNMLSGLPSRFPAPAQSPSPSPVDSPLLTRATSMKLSRTPSSSTLASDSFPALKPAAPVVMGTWAAKAAAPAPFAPVSPDYKPANREELIARNRAGQRVDPPCKDYDKTEVDRVKKIKMCNVHFLRKECPFDTNCTHLHAYKPTKEELSTLRLVARMAPCQNGSGCQDIKCIYGHRCPAPPSKSSHVKGTKSCIFGEACKFPPELHDVDCNVVKTLVIR